MIKGKISPKIFFGWWTVLASCTVVGLVQGFYNQGFSVFFKSLSADLGLSRALTSGATGINRLESGVASPLAGWLSDKFGPKWVIFTGTCIVAIGLSLMNFINSLWTFYLVWGTIGFGSSLGLTIAIDKNIANWFVRKRGLAIGMRFVIAGICGVILLPTVTWLVTKYGWRTTNLIWAGVVLATLPLIWFFVKQKRPEYYGQLPDGAKIEPGLETNADAMIDKGVKYAAEVGEVEFTVRQAMKTRSYWTLFIAWCFGMIVSGGIGIHIIPFLTDRGIAPLVASGMYATMIFFTIPTRLLGGFLADRIRKDRLHFLLAGCFLFQATGLTIVVLSQTIPMLYLFLIVYGLGNGASTPIRVVIGSRYFGRRAFGSILGSILMVEAPLGFLAPIYSGLIYDTTGSYKIAFTTFAVLSGVSSFLMFLVRPPKPPAVVANIHKFM